MRQERKFGRIDLSESIELVHNGRSYHGYLENLSMNGALVKLDVDITVLAGDSCHLYIRPAGEGKDAPPLHLGSVVVHGNRSLVGLKFIAGDYDTKNRLWLLMQRMMKGSEKIKDEMERIREYLDNYHRTLKKGDMVP